MSLIQSEDHDDGVRILRIDNGKPNAVSTAMSTELIAALEAAEKDTNAVIINPALAIEQNFRLDFKIFRASLSLKLKVIKEKFYSLENFY